MHSAGVRIAMVREYKELLLNQFMGRPLKSTFFLMLCEVKNYTNVWEIPSVGSQLKSNSHGLFRATALAFQMQASHQDAEINLNPFLAAPQVCGPQNLPIV